MQDCEKNTKIVSVSDYDVNYFKGIELRYEEGIYINRIKNIKRFLNMLNVAGEYCLDIGCGTGFFSQMLIQRDAKVISADFSRHALGYCKRIGENLALVQCSAESMPFLSDSFKFVLALDIIEHLYKPEKFISEIHRILKSEGQLLISTNNGCHLGNLKFIGRILSYMEAKTNIGKRLAKIQSYESKTMGRIGDSSHHVKVFSFRELRNLLQDNGFKVLDYDTFPYTFLAIRDFIFGLPVIRKCFKKYRGDNMILLATKISPI